MSNPVGLRVNGLNFTRRKMKTRMRRLKNMRGMMGRMLVDVQQVIDVNFNTAGGGHRPARRWKALKPATRKQKQAEGRDGGILIRTGLLRMAWIDRVTNNTMKIGSFARSGGKLYAKYHERGIGLPQRKILPTKNHTRRIAMLHLGKHVKFSVNV